MVFRRKERMRLIRIPYCYLTNSHLTRLGFTNLNVLQVVHDIHNGILNTQASSPNVRPYIYHPSFLRWVHSRVMREFKARGNDTWYDLDEKYLKLKSRSIKEFLPPTEKEIADDVVWLLRKTSKFYDPSGKKLPVSYVNLAIKYYGIYPENASLERIDEVSGVSVDTDSNWYQV